MTNWRCARCGGERIEWLYLCVVAADLRVLDQGPPICEACAETIDEWLPIAERRTLFGTKQTEED